MRKLTRVAWLVAVVVLLARGGLHAAGDDWRERAASAVRDGRVAEALELYRLAVTEQPTNTLFRKDLMWLLWDQEEYAECATHAEFILVSVPEDLECIELAARSRHRLGEYEAALSHYRRALELRPNQPGIELDIVRIHEARKDYALAYESLQDVIRRYPDAAETLPMLARLLEVTDQFEEAAVAWARAAAAYPEYTDYRYRQAQALHFAGQEEECARMLAAVLETDPGHAASRDFLVRVALLDGRLQEAVRLMESQTWDGSAGDVPGLLRLAALYQRMDDNGVAVTVLLRVLELAPDHSEARVMLAESLQQLGRWEESLDWCLEALELHPGCLRAGLTLATGYQGEGRFPEVVDALAAVRALDPSSPSILLRQAQALYLAGEKDESRALLEAWLGENNVSGPDLPVLLYHGLAVSPRDPMLASKIHMTTRRFEEQLQGMQAAGYQSVSIQQVQDWIITGAALPTKPFLIAFDDGRLDSLREADPVLARLGFTAVMFVAGINADKNLPGYASWAELRAFKDGGRWELQSHGDLASVHVPVGADGLTGNFLANRQWLADEQRLESVEEWEARILGDYRSISLKLDELTSVRPAAHAWPEGNYGQQAYVNVATATERNLAMTRESFRLGFHQGGLGVNLRSRDPILLERLEPDPEWHGELLVAQIEQRSPVNRVLGELFLQALGDRDAERANHWLDVWGARGVSGQTLLWGEARLAILNGHYDDAQSKLKQYIEADRGAGPVQVADAWNLIGMANQLAGDYAAAERAYETSLSIDPDQPQVMLDWAATLEAARRYDRSLELCLELHRTHPEFGKVLPALGRLNDLLGRPLESMRWWSLAVEAFPDNTEYAFQAERVRYSAGDHDEAIRRMELLLEENPDYEETRQFLIQCALVRGDLDGALRLLEEWQRLDGEDSVSRSVQMARLHVQQGRYSRAVDELRRSLALEPDHGEARLLLGECLRLQGDPDESSRVLGRIVEENPSSRRAWLGLADAWLASGEPDRAAGAVRELRRTDPEDPWFLLKEADCEYSAGNHEASGKLLNDWLASHQGAALPVLRYRGLAVDPLDPIMAQRDNQTAARFAEHLNQLHEAGYRTVTCAQVAAWLRGEGDLPDRAVMLTFDGTSLNSLRLADPVLEQHGFQAVLFVDVRNAGRNLPGYANWDELKDFGATGRWELQSAGSNATTQVVVNENGGTGRFLSSRKWDETQVRLETEAEWRARVTEEHRSAVLALRNHLGIEPIAFAWPDGDYGQAGVPNFAGSAAMNAMLAGESYQLAFGEDGHGQNLQSGDPIRLARLAPRQAWSGRDLVSYIEDENPPQRVLFQLLRQAAWRGRIHEGYRWLEELRVAGASASRLATAEALLRTMAGDPGHASALLREEVVQGVRTGEMMSLERSIERKVRPRARLSLDGWVDSDGRHALAGHFGGDAHVAQNTRLSVEGTLGEHYQDNLGSISEIALEFGVVQQLSAFHRIEARAGGHLFEAPAEDLVSYGARWDASWSDAVSTGAGLEFQPGYTVEMLAQDVHYHRAQLDGTWSAGEEVTVRLVGRYWAYTDDNTRVDLTANLAYELPWVRNLQALYRLTLADTANEEPGYYTPQQLVQNQVGLEYLWKPSDDFAWRFRYLPGYGFEQGGDGRFVHALHTDLLIRDVLTLDVRPVLDYQQTPTYNLFRFLLLFERSF